MTGLDDIRRELERAVPAPDPGWRSRLRAAVVSESRRLGAERPRPAHLRARAGLLIAAGLLLLVLVATQL